MTGKLLFLDFDGVLHPNFSVAKALFAHTEILVSVIASAHEPPGVVISSSWRFHHDESDLMGFLDEPLRRLVIGCTPMVEPGKHQRYREIQAFLKNHRKQEDWRALDDEVMGYPDGCRELIICDGRRGIDTVALNALKSWLAITLLRT